jgi:hypothetical protein
VQVLFSHCCPRNTLNNPTTQIVGGADQEVCSLLIRHYAGFSDRPHSRQEVSWRNVIKPQNGHILCNRTSAVGGLSVAASFPNKPMIEARRLRMRLRSGPKLASIDPPSFFLQLMGLFRPGDKRAGMIQETPRRPRPRIMTRQTGRFCAGLLTLHEQFQATG